MMLITNDTKRKIIWFIFAWFIIVPFLRLTGSGVKELIYHYFLCTLIFAWGASIHKRIGDRRSKILFRLLTYQMLFWFLIRIFRYHLLSELPDVSRFIWYCYYIPMMSIPLISFYLSICLMRNPKEKVLKNWIWCTALALILMLGVLTNDLHQWMFSFSDFSNPANPAYSYGWLYFVVVAYIIGMSFSAMIIIFNKCAYWQYKKWIWVPFVILVVCVFFSLQIATDVDIKINGLHYMNLNEIICFALIAIWEFCVQIGLVQANSGYAEIFKESHIAAWITDMEGTVIYRGMISEKEVPSKLEINTEENQQLLEDNKRIHRQKIPGGYLFYIEDLATINRLNSEIEDANEILAGENMLIEEENKLQEEKVRYQTMNSVYDEIARIVHPEVIKIEALLKEAGESEEEFCRRISKASFYNAYIKRRSNYVLQHRQKEELEVMELYLGMHESLEYFNLCGKEGMIIPCKEEYEYPAKMICDAYDYFQSILDSNFDGLQAVMIHIMAESEVLTIKYNFSLNESFQAPSKDNEGVVIEEDEEEITITHTMYVSGGAVE